MVRTMSTRHRLHGLCALLGDVVEHGSTAVEKVHKATTDRAFRVLEAIPPLAAPVRLVHVVHDASVGSVYGTIRVVSRVVGRAIDVIIDNTHGDP